MSELKIVYQLAFLYQVELAKSKLASRGIPSYVKNEFVNHVVVMPISQNYHLLVNEKDWENALKILEEIEENEL